MIHYSCDRCHRLIETEDEIRYVVRLNIEPKLGENVFDHEDDDRDHLLEIHEILEQQEETSAAADDDEVYCRKRFDLCYECYQAFLRNPMGQESPKPVDFSQN